MLTTLLDTTELNQRFESWTPRDIVAWSIGTFGSRIAVPASMGDTVLVHLATTVDPDIEVIFLDTGFHFAETLSTLRTAQGRYRLNLRVERPASDAPDLFERGTEACCAARKVEPLNRALEGKDAWMTGLRRSESEARAATPIVSIDKRGLYKICPIANMSDAEVDRYILDNDVVVNPLLSQGYPSIGCWPCTNPVADSSDSRSGRWAGSGKTECGLHL